LLNCTDANGVSAAALGTIVLPAPSLSVGGSIELLQVYGDATNVLAVLNISTPSGFLAGSVKLWRTTVLSANVAANGSSHATMSLVGPMIGTRVSLHSTGGLWVVDAHQIAYGATTSSFA
jgi:hypothetical protein